VALAMQRRAAGQRADETAGGAGGVPWWARRRLWTSTLKWLAARAVPHAGYRLRTSYGRQINRGLVAGFRRPADAGDPRPAHAPATTPATGPGST